MKFNCSFEEYSSNVEFCVEPMGINLRTDETGDIDSVLEIYRVRDIDKAGQIKRLFKDYYEWSDNFFVKDDNGELFYFRYNED